MGSVIEKVLYRETIETFKKQFVRTFNKLKSLQGLSPKEALIKIDMVYSIIDQIPIKTFGVSTGFGQCSVSVEEIVPYNYIKFQYLSTVPDSNLFDVTRLVSYKDCFSQNHLSQIINKVAEFKFNPTSFPLLQQLLETLNEFENITDKTLTERSEYAQVIPIRAPSMDPNQRIGLSSDIIVELLNLVKSKKLKFSDVSLLDGYLILVPQSRDWYCQISPVCGNVSGKLMSDYFNQALTLLEKTIDWSDKSITFDFLNYAVESENSLILISPIFNIKLPFEPKESYPVNLKPVESDAVSWKVDDTKAESIAWGVVGSYEHLVQFCERNIPVAIEMPELPFELNFFADVEIYQLAVNEVITFYKTVLNRSGDSRLQYVLFPNVRRQSSHLSAV